MKQTQQDQILKHVAIAVVSTCIGTFASCCLLAVLVLNEVVPSEVGSTFAVVLMGLWIFFSCSLQIGKIPQRKLVLALVIAALLIGLGLLIKTAAFPACKFNIDWKLSVPIVAAVLAGLFASRKKKRRR